MMNSPVSPVASKEQAMAHRIKWDSRLLGSTGLFFALAVMTVVLEMEWHRGRLEDTLLWAMGALGGGVAVWWLGPWVAQSIQHESWRQNVWKGAFAGFATVAAMGMAMGVFGFVVNVCTGNRSDVTVITELPFWIVLFGTVPGMIVGLFCTGMIALRIRQLAQQDALGSV